jgi:putative ABC transport system ATP-binding protein
MSREIMNILERINEAGTTIVMVTHSPECAERAHRQLHVFDGRMVDIDRPRVSLTREASAGISATLG